MAGVVNKVEDRGLPLVDGTGEGVDHQPAGDVKDTDAPEDALLIFQIFSCEPSLAGSYC